MSLHSIVSPPAEMSNLSHQTEGGILINEAAADLPQVAAGKYVKLPDGRIAGIAGNPGRLLLSDDGGETWEEREGPDDPDVELSPTGALLCTDAGTLVAGFANLAQKHWTWDDDLRDAPGARLPTCVMRSEDGGDTWQDVQTLHEEWTGATRDVIQTSDGRIVLCTMKMLHDPGRHSVMTYVSDEDGKTWQEGDLLDLGGNGHHDGLTEGTVVELEDGRLLQYIRTNWGEFWRAESTDGGRRWHPYGPTGVAASSAPAMLTRLESGRIMLLWNRPFPEGEDTHPLRGGDGIWSATPTSNHREELSISFSKDQCATWSPPVVVARNPGSEVSYPLAFEPEPGRLWITAWRWDLAVEVREEDFLR